MQRPPVSGPGSGVDMWRAYAADVLDRDPAELSELTRDQIIDLLPDDDDQDDPRPVVDLAQFRNPARDRKATSDADLVEQALVAERLLASRYADGTFNRMAVRAYRNWQRRLGYHGREADGVPDFTSLKRLGDKHGFDIVR